MKPKYFRLLSVICLCLFISGSAYAQPEPLMEESHEEDLNVVVDPVVQAQQLDELAPAANGGDELLDNVSDKDGSRNEHTATGNKKLPKIVHYETSPDSTEKSIYVIQLEDAPLATYRGDVDNLRATNPNAAGTNKLDARSADSRAYRSYLRGKQAQFSRAAEQAIGESLNVIYYYDVVYNGMAVSLTPQQAQKLLDIQGVITIQRDTWRYPMTDNSPDYLKVTGIWDGSATGGKATKGEGIIVGVIDSGIWPEHPSFTDDGSYPAPKNWPTKNVCDAPEAKKADKTGKKPFDPYSYSCNNKLIGVQYFLDGYVRNGYDGLFYSGRDDDGHGTHTASTAAGNENVPVTLYGINRGKVSGMAPRAHIASYKGLGPGGGTGADLVAAINKAVEDGVDAINYSVGSSFATDPWIDSDAQAYLAAREAGIFVATSAGNSGPQPKTIGSPANAPWVMSVGASYQNRLYISDITLTGPVGTPPTGLYGGTSTPGLKDMVLVSAEGYTDTVGVTDGTCKKPFPHGTFTPSQVVLCKKVGGVVTWAMGRYVKAGGAAGVIIYNDNDNIDLNSYLHPTPTVLTLNAVGKKIKDYLAANAGKEVKVSFTQGEPVFAPDPRIPLNTSVGFSSRGPNINENTNELISTIKPDITAPGIHVFAGASPETGKPDEKLEAQGEYFQLIQGTSMSSPHIAGLGALLKALHPSWSPDEIQSAIMLTARSQGLKARYAPEDDAVNHVDQPADPFDVGSGYVNISAAAKAGFVLDETKTNYDAANPAKDGDPSSLNIPSLAQAKCLQRCSWSRIISSSVNSSVDWTVQNAPTSGTLTYSPKNFTLAPGASQVISVTMDVSGLPLEKWAFAQLDFTPSDSNIPNAHMPIAVKPVAGKAPVATLDVETRRNKGSYKIEGLTALKTDALSLKAYSGTPNTVEKSIAQDSDKRSAYDDLTDGVYTTTVDVLAGSKGLVVEILASTAPDLDMFVGIDTNNDGKPEADEQLCSSTSGSWNEICTFPVAGKPLQIGKYWVVIQNWGGSGAAKDDFTLATTVVGGTPSSEITMSGPSAVETNKPFDATIAWDIPSFKKGESKFAILEMGTSAANSANVASVPFKLNRVADDLTIVSNVEEGKYVLPGDMVEYTLTIKPELAVKADTIKYDFTATLPTGLTYVDGSASITPTKVEGQKVSWTADVPTTGNYNMTTNKNDASCKTPVGDGGYVDLTAFNRVPDKKVSGNNKLFSFNKLRGSGASVEFYGKTYKDGLYFTDDGFLTVDSDVGSNRTNVDIPNTAKPNNLIAPFWREMEIVYDSQKGRGVTLAGNSTMFIEFDDLKIAGTEDTLDFEVIMRRTANNSPGAYEIFFAYDNIKVATSPATIGLENADASKSVKYAFNDAQLSDGLVICFDYVDKVQAAFKATVDANITRPAELETKVEHTIPGSAALVATSTIGIPDSILSINVNSPAVVAKGENITYTFVVSNGGSSAANNLKVVADMPAGTSHISGGTLSDDKERVSFDLPPVGENSTVPVTLVVKPNTPSTGLSTGTPRIIGGGPAKPGAWPAQVALINAKDAKPVCGGTLIAPEWIMTAAQCLDKQTKKTIDVLVGRHDLSSSSGQRISVSQIVTNSKYTAGQTVPDYDIALLRLAQPATLTGTAGVSGSVNLMSLATTADSSLVEVGKGATVIGWGTTVNSSKAFSDTLRQTSVQLTSNEACAAAAGSSISGRIICAGFAEGGKDFCSGDEGGPLMAKDAAGVWKQIGIASSHTGSSCAKPDEYGTYTRVPALTNWIEQAQSTYEIEYYYVTDGTNKVGRRADGAQPALTLVGNFNMSSVYLPIIISKK